MGDIDAKAGAQGCRFTVHALASDHPGSSVVNTWAKSGVQTGCTPGPVGVFKQCSRGVHTAVRRRVDGPHRSSHNTRRGFRMDWLVQCGVKKTGNLSGCIFLAIWLGPAFFLAPHRSNTRRRAHECRTRHTNHCLCAKRTRDDSRDSVLGCCWDVAGMVLRGCLECA